MTIATRPLAPLFLAVTMAALLLSACSGPQLQRTQHFPRATIKVNPEQRNEVVLTAMALLDSRYKYGGSVPAQGFDCSGLVAYVFNNAANQTLPHNTAEIASLSRPISRKHLKAGDFVFFNTLNRPFSHMGIYIGDDNFINAPSTGGRVRIDSLSNPYFAKRFESARTVFGG
ncbi:MAG TPA: C40 family peptidase [Eoetvoesiella sp.]